MRSEKITNTKRGIAYGVTKYEFGDVLMQINPVKWSKGHLVGRQRQKYKNSDAKKQLYEI